MSSARHADRLCGSSVADPNRALFQSVVHLFAPVLDELVFVGGCTTGLFITDPAAHGIRPTGDVDAIVDVTSYAEYTALAERFRTLGLREDTTPGAPLCRWRDGQLIVDIMPTDATVLSFSNRWYPTAIDTAETFHTAGHDVRVVTPALFIATKLEAFHGRGGNDVVASHDLEDIIAVVDGRPEIVDDGAGADVRGYIGTEIRALLDDPNFIEALGGFLLPDAASHGRRSESLDEPHRQRCEGQRPLRREFRRHCGRRA